MPQCGTPNSPRTTPMLPYAPAIAGPANTLMDTLRVSQLFSIHEAILSFAKNASNASMIKSRMASFSRKLTVLIFDSKGHHGALLSGHRHPHDSCDVTPVGFPPISSS